MLLVPMPSFPYSDVWTWVSIVATLALLAMVGVEFMPVVRQLRSDRDARRRVLLGLVVVFLGATAAVLQANEPIIDCDTFWWTWECIFLRP